MKEKPPFPRGILYNMPAWALLYFFIAFSRVLLFFHARARRPLKKPDAVRHRGGKRRGRKIEKTAGFRFTVEEISAKI